MRWLVPLAAALVDVPEDEVAAFTLANLEPRGAVLVLRAPAASAARRLVAGLEKEVEELFGAVVAVEAEDSALEVRYRSVLVAGAEMDPPRSYTGAFARKPLLAWLQVNAYPLVNVIQSNSFPAPKYLQSNRFALLLLVADFEQQAALLGEVRPFATFFRKTLKVTFFSCTENVQFVCDRLGAEHGTALLVERPADIPADADGLSHVLPLVPKYRGQLADGVGPFLEAWREKKLTPFWKAARPKRGKGFAWLDGAGLQERAVRGSGSLVLFVSGGSADTRAACAESMQAWGSLANRLRESRARGSAWLYAVNQSENEHGELVPETPWVRYWPPGGEAPLDVERRSAAGLLDYLEDFAEL